LTLVYLCDVPSNAIGASVRAAAQVPHTINSSVLVDGVTLYCNGIDSTDAHEREGYWFNVNVTFDSSAEPRNENPLLRPYEVSISGEDYMRVTTVDAAGNPFRNVVGDLIAAEDRQVLENIMLLRIKRNEAQIGDQLIYRFKNSINKTAFLGYG